MDSQYHTPTKVILTPAHLEYFQESETYKSVIGYIEILNEAVAGASLTAECTQSEGITAALKILDEVENLVKETPPIDNKSSRFGNPAFKDFYDKVSGASTALHATLPNLPHSAIPEVSVYFNESWGNRTRVDYGSGMELNFLCWMLCLEKIGVFNESDHKALVLRLFWRYISVMRVVQSTYWLEPAGSHGVWGLDDYHFLPFLFGSSQLRGHKYLRPKSIHDKEIVEEFSKQYMYLACIQFINSIKTASLRWHSPMLDDISAVKTWDKTNSGMLKMYRAEVLGKLPVMQHFLFGSSTLLPLTLPASLANSTTTSSVSPDDPHYGHAHTHTHGQHPGLAGAGPLSGPGGMMDLDASGGVGQAQSGWGDCCGIPVPSAFGAAAAAAADTSAAGLRSLDGPGSGPTVVAAGGQPPKPIVKVPFKMGGAVRPVPFD